MTLPAGGPSRNLEFIRRVAPRKSTRKLPRDAAKTQAIPIGHDLSTSPRQGLHGCVESVTARGIKGWLLDARDLGRQLAIEVRLDGVRLFSCVADRLRPDVSRSMGEQVDAGFELRWSEVRPAEPLLSLHEREGKLEVLAPDGRELPLPKDLDPAQLYDWIEPHVDRLSYVLGTSQVAPPPMLSDDELLDLYFDAGFYLAMYPDAANNPADARAHYIQTGCRSGHDPHPDFSSRHYLESNPDVRDAGINPFLHHLRTGCFEGRQARPPGGHRAETLAQLVPLADTVKSWRRQDALRALSARTLLARLREQIGGVRPRGLVLSISHDDYTTNVGGVQLCLAIEQQAYNERGYLYLHLSPWQGLPCLHTGSQPMNVALRLLCNGAEVGYTLGGDLQQVVDELRDDLIELPAHLVVHALHGHAPEVVTALHKALRPSSSYYWLHDFFSLCTGHNLLRNQISFCGAPPAGSAACTVCVYGAARDPQLVRMQRLFESVAFTAIAPSAHTAALWQQRSALPVQGVVVHPHCVIEAEGHRIGSTDLDADEGSAQGDEPVGAPIRVAYLGHPTVHKGWPVFRELVRQVCGTGKYEFWHLGTQPDESLPVRFVGVKVSPEDPDAMLQALDAAGIDVVVQWSQWPETFGIAARESVAAGALMVVSQVSGAVAEFVDQEQAGLVMEQEAELMEAFRGPQIARLVAERRRMGAPVGRLVWSQLTADLTDTVKG
jgi:hypothetical protein